MEDTEEKVSNKSNDKIDSRDNSSEVESSDKLRQDADLSSPKSSANSDSKSEKDNRSSEPNAIETKNGRVEALFFDNSIYSNKSGFKEADSYQNDKWGKEKSSSQNLKGADKADQSTAKAAAADSKSRDLNNPPEGQAKSATVSEAPNKELDPKAQSSEIAPRDASTQQKPQDSGADRQDTSNDRKPQANETDRRDAPNKQAPEDQNGRPANDRTAEQQKRLDDYIKEKGYTREVGPDGKVTLTDKAGLKIELKSGSPEFQERMLREIEKIPENERRLLAQSGHKISVVEKVTDADPSLANQQPRGWPPGRTWDDADGAYIGGQKNIVVAERTRSGPSNRAEGVLKHEVGHAIDVALDNFSQSKEFKEAYEKDLAKLTPEQRKYYSYFLQPNNAGAQEAFADIYGAINGSSANPSETQRILQDFPHLAAAIRQRLARRS